jgi:hypothetical protein
VCLASLLHYNVIRQGLVTDDASAFSREGNIEHLKTRRGFSRIQDATLPRIKAELLSRGIPCRPGAVEGLHAVGT